MFEGDQAAVAAPWTSDGPSRGWLSRLPRALTLGSDVRRALLLTLVWEFVGEAVGWAASFLIPPDPNDISATIAGRLFPGEHLSHFEAIWVRWDGSWYALLGSQGYSPHVSILDAFFPAYPLLIHIVGTLLGGRYLVAGVVINRLLLFPTVVIFMKLVQRDGVDNSRESELAPLMILLIPGAVFFLGALTETLFVFACLATMLAMRRERWLLAAAACALATGTRLPGVALVGTLGLELVLRRKWFKAAYCSAIGMGGIGLFSLYTLITQHDPLGFRDAYAHGSWNDQSFTLNVLRGPARYFHKMVADPPTRGYPGIVTLGYMVALALIVLLAALCFRRLSWPLRLFVVGTTLIPLLSGSMFSYYRYAMIPLLPMMVPITRWLAGRPAWRDSTVLTLAGLTIFDVMAFASGHWVS